MCVFTSITMASIGAAVASSLASAAAAAGTAATAIGTGIVTGMGMVGSGLAATGSAIASGASAVGSAIASGASAAWGAAATAVESIGTGLSAVTTPFTEAYAAGAAASESMGAGLMVDGALVGSTEATALNAGAEASMLMGMAENGVALTAENTAAAAAGAKAAAGGSLVAKAAGATAGVGGLGGVVKGGIAGAQLAGGAVEAHGAYQGAKEDAQTLKNQAKNAETQARQVIDSAEVEAKDLARKRRQSVGAGKVAAAGNGVMLEAREVSSPAMWEQDMQAEAAWDREKLFHNANIKADALHQQASIYRTQARQVRKSGNLKAASALIRGGIGAGLTLYGNPATTLYS